MPLLTNKKRFPFRSYGGGRPTVEDVRVEMEKMYEFIEKDIENLSLNSFGGALTSDFIESVNASSIVGTIAAGQIGSVNAENIVGQISASQIGSVNASSIAGVINAGQIGSINASSITGVIVTNQLADQILNTQRLIASDISLIKRVTVLPALPNVNFPVDSIVIHTPSKTLYQNVANTWAVVTASSNIVGTLTAGDIGSVNANTIVGLIIAAQISTVNASSIIGTITAAQIGSVNASSITGTITSTQIGSINAATITIGLLQSNQINTINAGQLTAGTISAQAIVVSGGTSGYFQSNNFVAGVSGWRLDGAGTLQAVAGTFSGTVTSTAGTIGGLTLSATTLSAGANATFIELSSLGTAGLQVGTGTSDRAFVRASASVETGFFAANSSGNIIGSLVLNSSHAAILTVGGGVGASTEGVQVLGATSKLLFGQIGSADTNLYRSAADTLKTDDSLIVDADFTANTSANLVGFAFASGSLDNAAGAGLHWSTTSGRSQIDLGATSGVRLSLRRTSGSTLGVLMVDGSANVLTNITGVPGSGGAISINNSSGTAVVSFDGSVSGGSPKFGVHTGIGGESLTGYITITDSAGNSRKLGVVS